MWQKNQQPTTFSTPDLAATLQVPSSMMQEQNEQIFEIMRQKAEDERQVGYCQEVRARVRADEKGESNPPIAANAAAAAAAATVVGPSSKKSGEWRRTIS